MTDINDTRSRLGSEALQALAERAGLEGDLKVQPPTVLFDLLVCLRHAAYERELQFERERGRSNVLRQIAQGSKCAARSADSMSSKVRPRTSSVYAISRSANLAGTFIVVARSDTRPDSFLGTTTESQSSPTHLEI